jgi:hypothetical protein
MCRAGLGSIMDAETAKRLTILKAWLIESAAEVAGKEST